MGEKKKLEVKIRFYKQSDYSDVMKNLEEGGIFAPVWESEENLASMIKKDPKLILIAEVDGKVIGNLIILPYGSITAYIWAFAVRRAYKNQGIGTKLLKKAEDVLKRKGIKQIALFVDMGNTDLLDYYSKRGFGKARKKYAVMWKEL